MIYQKHHVKVTACSKDAGSSRGASYRRDAINRRFTRSIT